MICLVRNLTLMAVLHILRICQSIIIINSMVDRYKSLISDEISKESLDRNVRVNQIVDVNREIVQRTNSHATRMREIISRYRRNVSRDADDCIAEFKEEQKSLVKDRNILKDQLDVLEKKKKKDTPEYNFMKKELLRAIKNEIQLDLELNQEVTKRKQEREILKQKILQNSPKLADAVRDIQSKLQQIIYLEKSINQCLQLLEIIGILTHQNGEKLDDIYDRVREANVQIELAEVNIDKAKIAMEKSRCKMCCIIILALAAIIIILIALFGLVQIQQYF